MRGAVVLALLFVLSVAAGCSGGAPAPTTSASPSPALAPSPTTEPDPVESAREYAEAAVQRMALSDRVATLLMLHAPGTDPQTLREFVERYRPGGFILMGDNIPGDPDALRAITAALSPDPGLPLIVGVDQEGGVVRRIESDSTPGAEVLRDEAPEATREAFATRGELLAGLGVSVNFGIVADVTADPGSFIIDRVLGTQTAPAAERVAAAVTGERGQVWSTLKHFPGHGEVSADSHHTVPTTPVSLDHWRERDEPPFRAGIAAGAEFVMFGHLTYSAVDASPASLSPRWHELLREDLGFEGIAITDAMGMLRDSGLPEYQDAGAVAVRALAAGNTMLLYVLPADPASVGSDPEAIISAVTVAVQEGRLSVDAIDDAAVRVLTLRRELSGHVSSGQGMS